MKNIKWVFIGGLFVVQNLPAFCENTVTAEQSPSTILNTTNSSINAAISSHSVRDTVPVSIVLEPRLYTETDDPKQFEEIGRMYEKADAFLFCIDVDKIACQLRSRHQSFIQPLDGASSSILHSRDQVERRLRPEAAKRLLVMSFPCGQGATAREITAKMIEQSKQRINDMTDFINQLGFERVLIFMPHIGTRSSEMPGVARQATDGYYILADNESVTSQEKFGLKHKFHSTFLK